LISLQLGVSRVFWNSAYVTPFFDPNFHDGIDGRLFEEEEDWEQGGSPLYMRNVTDK
jgi:hypothetical protein